MLKQLCGYFTRSTPVLINFLTVTLNHSHGSSCAAALERYKVNYTLVTSCAIKLKMKVLTTTEIFFLSKEIYLDQITLIENLIKIDTELFSVKDMLFITYMYT